MTNKASYWLNNKWTIIKSQNFFWKGESTVKKSKLAQEGLHTMTLAQGEKGR